MGSLGEELWVSIQDLLFNLLKFFNSIIDLIFLTSIDVAYYREFCNSVFSFFNLIKTINKSMIFS